MPRNDSHYGGTWYKPVGSLVGKPRGIATDPLIHGKGSVNLLLQLGRKAHVHAPTRDDERLPWGDSRSSPRSMSAMDSLNERRKRKKKESFKSGKQTIKEPGMF